VAHPVKYFVRFGKMVFGPPCMIIRKILDKYFVTHPYVGKDVRNCGFEFKELEIFDKFEMYLKYGWF